MWTNGSPQSTRLADLCPRAHTNSTHSTAFYAAPVGVMEKCGRLSPLTHWFSKSPFLHSRVLENLHLPEARAHTHLRSDSHFSYPSYGCFWLSFISTHTYPPSPSRSARVIPPVTIGDTLRASPYVPKSLVLVFQRIGPDFHAPFSFRIATIRVMKRGRFRGSASCCTVGA